MTHRDMAPPPDVAERLARERNVWMCTLRPDGSPHVTPVWFIYQHQTWWIGSDEQSLKVRNVKADPRVALALEDGTKPVVAEGRAHLRSDFPDEVVKAFAAKYAGWDVRLTYGSSGGRILFEVPVDRWLLAGTAQ
jgi:F420H(2)-dependent biliverdin reductase